MAFLMIFLTTGELKPIFCIQT